MKDHLDNSKLQLESHFVDDERQQQLRCWQNDVDENSGCVDVGLNYGDLTHWQWTNLLRRSLNSTNAVVTVM